MFIKTLAAKLYEKKITSIQCITVNPGIVNTNMVSIFIMYVCMYSNIQLIYWHGYPGQATTEAQNCRVEVVLDV